MIWVCAWYRVYRIALTGIATGGMKIIPGSHTAGLLQHTRRDRTDSIITLELETGTFREADAVQFKLKTGEVTLHDDRAAHG